MQNIDEPKYLGGRLYIALSLPPSFSILQPNAVDWYKKKDDYDDCLSLKFQESRIIILLHSKLKYDIKIWNKWTFF